MAVHPAQPKPKPTPAPPVQPAGVPWVDILATISARVGAGCNICGVILLAIIMIPLMAFLCGIGTELVLVAHSVRVRHVGALILGILSLFGTLFGFGVMIGRDDAPAGINSFTTVCNYRNLTQRDMFSMTFDTSAARDAFSCPWVRKNTVPREQRSERGAFDSDTDSRSAPQALSLHRSPNKIRRAPRLPSPYSSGRDAAARRQRSRPAAG